MIWNLYDNEARWGAILRRASINNEYWLTSNIEIAGGQMLRHVKALVVYKWIYKYSKVTYIYYKCVEMFVFASGLAISLK